MAFQTFTTGQVLTAATMNSIQQVQYQGGEQSIGTGGSTITFASGRFTATPIVALATSYVTASGANPTGFAFIPYLGRPTTTSMVVATTAGTLQVFWTALATNI